MLTPRQQRIKDSLAGPYGDWVHEGQLLDPVCRDIEALFSRSVRAVDGGAERAHNLCATIHGIKPRLPAQSTHWPTPVVEATSG